MSGKGAAEKTEKPTPKKLKEARREGQIARSPDIGAWLGMLSATMVLPLVVKHGASSVTDLLMRMRGVAAKPEQASTLLALKAGLMAVATTVAPLAATTVLVAIAAAGGQGGLRPATKLLKPKFKRLNPFPGIKKMFGPQSAWEATKVAVKTGALALVLYSTVKSLMPLLTGSGALPIASTLGTAASAAISMIRTACMAGLAMAAADYFVARRRIGKQLKMSKQEIKEENRQTDGDPQMKGAIRSKQIAMSRNRMMSDIATADVVLVNPTHVAVALRYDPAKGAPRVVAKGAGHVAAAIRERADKHRVPMVQDIPLARALHKACEIGQEVPPEMYTAVATVLAFVMALKARGSAAGLHSRIPGRPAFTG